MVDAGLTRAPRSFSVHRMSKTPRVFLLLGVVTMLGCPPKTKPKVEEPIAKPAEPTGDTLRLKATQGDQGKGKVKLTIDQEAPGKKGKVVQVSLAFDFVDEEKVEVSGPDGAQISARFADATAKAIAGAKQDMADQLALALDDLKIVFKRSPRGEVSSLQITNVHAPLDEQTARSVVNAIFGAQRGAVLPEEPVELSKTWKVELPMPANSNYSGTINYQYTYAKKEGGIVTVTTVGTTDGKAGSGNATQKMSGKSSGEVRFELASGKLLASTQDNDVKIEMLPAGTAVKQHIRAEWTRGE